MGEAGITVLALSISAQSLKSFPAAVVFDKDVTPFEYEVSSGLTWTPTPPSPQCHPVSPRSGASPQWRQQDALTPRNYQGRVPAIRSHITSHQCAWWLPATLPSFSLMILSHCISISASSLPCDYSEICTLVKLALMDSVMHKLFAMAELWHSANRWRTCTSNDIKSKNKASVHWGQGSQRLLASTPVCLIGVTICLLVYSIEAVVLLHCIWSNNMLQFNLWHLHSLWDHGAC